MRTVDQIIASPTPKTERALRRELRVLEHALEKEERDFDRKHGRAMRQAAFRAVRQGASAGICPDPEQHRERVRKLGIACTCDFCVPVAG
jgi:hypothetical protein